MKRSVLITLTAIFVTMTFTQCLSAVETEIVPVYMVIETIAQIQLNNAQILLVPVSGGLDYEGVTSPMPSVTCNTLVTITATTVGEPPLVSTDWQTALQGTAYNGTPDSFPIDVSPIVAPVGSPFYFGVSVLAKNVDMTARPLTPAGGPPERVATTTITVSP
jgi:hypothetical protein